MTDYVFGDYFYGIESFDRAFGDALGQLNGIDIGMKPKRPDKKKLEAIIEKLAKSGGPPKGEFILSRSGDVITFNIRLRGTNIELAKLDIGAVKDLTKRRALMHKLNMRSRLYTTSDLEAFDKKHADVEDRGEAIEMNKRIDALVNKIDTLTSMQRSNYHSTEYSPYSSEFAAWIKKKGHERYTEFVDGKDGRGLSALLADPKTSGIRPATLAAIKAAEAKGEKPDYTQAQKDVLRVVTGLLAQYNKEKIAESEKEIKTAQTEIAGLRKQLAVMKAD